jgi:hypothetical protein
MQVSLQLILAAKPLRDGRTLIFENSVKTWFLWVLLHLFQYLPNSRKLPGDCTHLAIEVIEGIEIVSL